MKSTTRALCRAAATLVAALAGCSGGTGPAPGSPPKADPAVPVALQKVKVQPVQREVEVVGTLWADEDATISAKVPGRIGRVYKDVGDAVVSGDPLAQLITTDYLLARNQRALAVKEALAKIGLAEFPAAGGLDPEQVPAVKRAAQQRENAKARFERAKTLFEQQPPRISEEEFDDLRTAWEVAKSQYELEVLTAKATLEEARTRQAEFEIQDQLLLDTTIRAPSPLPQISMAGLPGPAEAPSSREYRVAARLVSEGEFVREGTPAFRLVDDRRLKLRARVPQRYALDLHEGQKVRMSPDSGDAEAWGTVTRINPQIDPANRTFEVEVLLPNAEHRLKAGAFAAARVQTRKEANVLFVPQEAVVSFAGVDKVFLVKDATAVERVVTLGEQKDGNWVEIRASLSPGDEVVVAGTSKLADGVRVVVKPIETLPGQEEAK